MRGHGLFGQEFGESTVQVSSQSGSVYRSKSVRLMMQLRHAIRRQEQSCARRRERSADNGGWFRGAAAPDEVLIEARGSLAVITLNRPRALNALTTAMRAKLAEAFPRFAREAQTYCVVIQSASEKAFSRRRRRARDGALGTRGPRARAACIRRRVRAQLAARMLFQADHLAHRRAR